MLSPRGQQPNLSPGNQMGGHGNQFSPVAAQGQFPQGHSPNVMTSPQQLNFPVATSVGGNMVMNADPLMADRCVVLTLYGIQLVEHSGDGRLCIWGNWDHQSA